MKRAYLHKKIPKKCEFILLILDGFWGLLLIQTFWIFKRLKFFYWAAVLWEGEKNGRLNSSWLQQQRSCQKSVHQAQNEDDLKKEIGIKNKDDLKTEDTLQKKTLTLLNAQGGCNHHPLSENHDSSATKHLVDLRPIFKLDFVCCYQIEKNQSALSVSV